MPWQRQANLSWRECLFAELRSWALSNPFISFSQTCGTQLVAFASLRQKRKQSWENFFFFFFLVIASLHREQCTTVHATVALQSRLCTSESKTNLIWHQIPCQVHYLSPKCCRLMLNESIPSLVLVEQTREHRTQVRAGTDEQQNHRQQTLEVEDGRLKRERRRKGNRHMTLLKWFKLVVTTILSIRLLNQNRRQCQPLTDQQ